MHQVTLFFLSLNNGGKEGQYVKYQSIIVKITIRYIK